MEAAVRKAAEFTEVQFTSVEKESVCNIVTSADLAVQQYLNEALCALLPGSGFFGEEGNSGAVGGEYLWIVDPIDGTMNFSRGIGEFCISVALLQGDAAILGLVFQPSQNKVFSAIRGQGAWCNGLPIRVSDASFAEGLFCTALSLYRKEYAPQCMAVIAEAYEQCNDVRRFGSCALADHAPWAPRGYANLMTVLAQAKALQANESAKAKDINDVVASLNAAINTMRPGNLAELEDLNNLLALLKKARAEASAHPTPSLTEAIDYADMVVKYVSDGSGTQDMIKNAEKRLNKLFTR